MHSSTLLRGKIKARGCLHGDTITGLKTSLKLPAGKTEELCDLPEHYHQAFATELIEITYLGNKEKTSSVSKKGGGKHFM